MVITNFKTPHVVFGLIMLFHLANIRHAFFYSFKIIKCVAGVMFYVWNYHVSSFETIVNNRLNFLLKC